MLKRLSMVTGKNQNFNINTLILEPSLHHYVALRVDKNTDIGLLLVKIRTVVSMESIFFSDLHTGWP